MVINVVCRKAGWLFDDLAAWFERARVDGVEVTRTQAPDPDADRWLYIRTAEAASTPDPDRTVVQVHDLFEEDAKGPLYAPGGTRAAVARCAGIVLTHPGQVDVVRRGATPPGGRRIPTWLLRPIGAASYFRQRPAERPAGPFTVGWVGRDVSWRGRNIRRLCDLAPVVEATETRPLRVLLVGQRLDAAVNRLSEIRGVEVEYHERSSTPHARYPELYHQMDVLLVTSVLEAGPQPLFEALACGVPVLSRPCGWAETYLGPSSPCGWLWEGVPYVAAHLDTLARERDDWRRWDDQRVDAVARWRLEDWVVECLELARGLA